MAWSTQEMDKEKMGKKEIPRRKKHASEFWTSKFGLFYVPYFYICFLHHIPFLGLYL